MLELVQRNLPARDRVRFLLSAFPSCLERPPWFAEVLALKQHFPCWDWMPVVRRSACWRRLPGFGDLPVALRHGFCSGRLL